MSPPMASPMARRRPRIYSSLFKAFEARGYAVVSDYNHYEAYAARREFALAEANRLDQRNNRDLSDLTVSETELYRFGEAS